ncbi:hypothetical protein CRYUN_Cryun08bG0148200 [Craigia yunnanensis]
MIACKKQGSKWSEKKMEGDDGLRTVECLRGRLLAERQSSKTAKEDAELIGNKLIELENKLKEETKLRNKAEKRLKLLRKKLESLTILPTLEESQQSSSSEHCAVSSVSSTRNSGTRDPEESASKSQNAVPEISKNVEENASDTTTSIKSLKTSFSEENSNSPGTTKSDTKDSSHEKSSGKSSSSHEDPKIDDTRYPLSFPHLSYCICLSIYKTP